MDVVPLRPESAAQMLAGGPDDAEVRKLTGTHRSFELEDYEAYIERTLNDPNRYTRAITQDGFGKGYGSAALQHVLDHAFTVLDLHRVDLEVYEFNERAIHVHKKLGFREEGRLRGALLWEGEFNDAIVMSILSTDNI
jgi:GNAT superfamily N-acetyltransferase